MPSYLAFQTGGTVRLWLSFPFWRRKVKQMPVLAVVIATTDALSMWSRWHGCRKLLLILKNEGENKRRPAKQTKQ